ncbi:MAG: hypothetical protein ACO37F_09245 [Pirellulales bacterium]|jgi:hypothetical protein
MLWTFLNRWSVDQAGWSVAAIRLRHDVRRPATWLSVAVAATVVGFVGVGLEASVSSFAVVTAAVVIAIGDVPAAFPVWDASLMLQPAGWYRCSRRPLALPAAGGWLTCRLLWPLLGLGSAGVAAAARGETAEVTTLMVATGSLAGGLSALTTAGLRLVGLSAADAATATLLAGWLAAAGMAFTGGVLPVGSEWPLLLVGFGCWLVAAGGLLGLAQWLQLAGEGPIAGLLPRQFPLAGSRGPRGPDRLAAIGLLGVLPACSPWRRALRNASMLLALSAMIGWLLLDPSSAGRYGWLGTAIFGGLAIPAATLLDGDEVSRGWRSLVRTVSGIGPQGRKLLTLPSPGLHAAFVFVGTGCLMLWPPLVVAVVAVGSSAALPALLVAACLAAGATLVGGGCVAAHLSGCRGDTALAIGLSLVVFSVWLWQASA